MKRTKKRVYSSTLPATPCTESMKEKIIKIAEDEEVSIADVQRRAFELFLVSNSINASLNASIAHSSQTI